MLRYLKNVWAKNIKLIIWLYTSIYNDNLCLPSTNLWCCFVISFFLWIKVLYNVSPACLYVKWLSIILYITIIRNRVIVKCVSVQSTRWCMLLMKNKGLIDKALTFWTHENVYIYSVLCISLIFTALKCFKD